MRISRLMSCLPSVFFFLMYVENGLSCIFHFIVKV
ncbi:putative peroxidase 18 [Iris pallida]|uniref:Peroxidase 18 n=1 Tax=Iris pallida TaxID=29817 RepID=A0AAX6F9G5_IRIPA|nr:putative peroxidase 18 [Iris pallida]